MTLAAPPTSQEIKAARPPKTTPDAWQPIGWSWEWEREAAGVAVPSLTALLAGAECPFTCMFCDLWRHTLDGPTPPGAIPAQIAHIIAAAAPLPPAATLKLYNASNYFDARAVPPEDDSAVATLVASFRRVVVECHPKLVGARCVRFAASLGGRAEVAMGLETVHPDAQRALNKGATLAEFQAAASRLAAHGIAWRAFVLVAPPFVPPHSAVDWAVRSAACAVEWGARHVSLIPTRGGNGVMEALAARGSWRPPTLAQLEEALDRAIGLPAVVTADLWDAAPLATCSHCGAARLARLAAMNLSGRTAPRVACERCGPP